MRKNYFWSMYGGQLLGILMVCIPNMRFMISKTEPDTSIFAILQGHLRLAIEIDGFGPHQQQISRSPFSDQLLRQNHLVIDGWKILRFSFDDVRDRPRMCEQLVQQFMGRWHSHSSHQSDLEKLSSEEKDILRLGIKLKRDLTPKDICLKLNIEQQKARKLLRQLVDKGFLHSAGKGSSRSRFYKLTSSASSDFLGM
ncbi:winged helix DNA-binding protein [Paenibacillus eucommiae]|uniref:DNA-binding MarR family transcriptional regulator n=1 Tax=Paenibacillus eucommiae TaxID=1355755 RepID=A0ABS4INC1_9BACL|nr:winged helix DNA-binding protein [Paenibacillus eucommiae]MBP1989058.1 DNA-binding MarR family transcriptional regulator [Paenibacillus eucommiae]